MRLGCFAGVLLLMAAWEALAPRRRLTVKRLHWMLALPFLRRGKDYPLNRGGQDGGKPDDPEKPVPAENREAIGV